MATLRVAGPGGAAPPTGRAAGGRERARLDLRGLSPRGPTVAGEWQHRIRRLDRRGRLPVPEVAQMGGGDALHAVLRPDRWELVTSGGSGGVPVDARLRILVPIGVRHQLRLGSDVVVSVAVDGSRLVVWPATRLDAVLVQP